MKPAAKLREQRQNKALRPTAYSLRYVPFLTALRLPVGDRLLQGRCVIIQNMGRIVASVKIESLADASQNIRCDALVDTGASHMVLPSAWKERLGDLELIETVELETATQDKVQGEICGPVRIQIEGFRHTYTEVMFVEMHPEDGTYEPLIGYIVLGQSQIAVDMIGHCLMSAKRMDLK